MATRVAVDAMGGDHAPAVVVEGAVRAAREAPDRLRVLLFGPEDVVGAELARHDAAGLPVEVVHAPEVIGMDDAPAAALKAKPHSSIHLGLRAHKAGEADAFASAGNTGAVMAAALFACGRLPGVLRPTIPGYFPTPEGLCLVLDVGANVDVKAEHLVQFALMGRVFARRVFGVENPSVGLINVGEEKGKGTEVVKEAYERLEALDADGHLHFVGNVEGRDLFRHRADVAVCDGFVGNVLLKLGESFASTLPQLIRQEIGRQGLDAREAEAVGRVLRETMRPFDHEQYGGVPLLGVDGVVVIGHGGSPAHAVEQMIFRAAEMAEQDLPAKIAEALKE
ncbi:MAG TPA: phosphate acyltransferase PlsX [Rubricoccaceae bacterium]|nr:phosphate acyltransferase PlsX [Rubricoccaceae bacterium]